MKRCEFFLQLQQLSFLLISQLLLQRRITDSRVSIFDKCSNHTPTLLNGNTASVAEVRIFQHFLSLVCSNKEFRSIVWLTVD